jgi:hypothetical protein
VIHPGPTVGFRVCSKQSVFTYLPDHEPALGRDGMLTNPQWISGIDLAAEADLLLHDAQYNKEEYSDRMGWGHSSMDDAIHFASMAGVKHLLLSHHDPSRTDPQLKELFSSFEKRNNYSFQYELAIEGTVFEL